MQIFLYWHYIYLCEYVTGLYFVQSFDYLIPMRLQPQEIAFIKKAFKNHFKAGEIYLFGSRVDDSKKGGDIDLYLCPQDESVNLHQKKIAFLVELDKTLGEQKIDAIIAKDKTRLIEQEALTNGIEL